MCNNSFNYEILYHIYCILSISPVSVLKYNKKGRLLLDSLIVNQLA